MPEENKSTDINDSGSQNGTPGLDGQNVHDLPRETLDSISIEDDGTLRVNPQQKGESAKPDEEPPAAEPDKPKAPPKGTPEGDDGNLADRLRNTQTAFHKKAREAAELRKKLMEAQAPKPPEEMGQDDLDNLKAEDPDAYLKYMDSLRDYKHRKEEYERQLQQSQAESERLAVQITASNLLSFFKSQLGMDVNLDVPWEEQPKEVRESFESPELQKIRQEIEAHPSRYYEDDGSVSLDTFETLYFRFFKDTILQNQRMQGRSQAVSAIQNAAESGSKLDRFPSDHELPGGAAKKIDQLTQEEIDSMSPEQLAYYYKQLDDSGG